MGPLLELVLVALLSLEGIQRALLLLAAACALRGLFLILFRVPVRMTLKRDGLREAEKARNAAVIMTERAPLPWTVEDDVAFTTLDGRDVLTTVRRPASPVAGGLAWYSPSNPERVTLIGPLTWWFWALLLLGLFAAVRWQL